MAENNDFPKSVNKNPMIPLVAGMVAAVVMIGSFIIALTKFSGPSVEPEASEESSVSDIVSENDIEEESSESVPAVKHEYYDTLTFQTVSKRNEDIVNGALAAIKDDSNGYPYIDQSRLVKVSSEKTPGIYGLSNTSLSLYSEAIKNIDAFLVEFYNNVPSNGTIISKAYTSGESISPTEGVIDLTTGYSVQLSIYNTSYKFSDDEFSFLREQAYKYGVIQRYPADKDIYTNHSSDMTIYRYVGIAHSSYMNYYNLSLEEYLDKIRTEKIIEFKTDLVPDVVFVSYYVPVSEDTATTEINVPENEKLEYTVSGDGTSGFVVTVAVKTTNIN